MASQVDETFPADNVRVSKSEMRDQFRVIKEEIEDLQRQNTLPWRLALKDFVDN